MSKIQWTEATWNPIRARRKSDGKVGWHCVRISPGCQKCYSERQNVQCGNNSGRAGTGLKYNAPSLQQVDLFLDEKTLLQPLHWKKGRMIFVCSMTDWMADFVPDEWRDKMLAVMALTPQHTYQTLTKRADRQREYFGRDRMERWGFWASWAIHQRDGGDAHRAAEVARFNEPKFPLPNLWLGVSCESPNYKDRIDMLRDTPAAVRMLSLEPLLEDLGQLDLRGIHWGIVGGESGPQARICYLPHVYSIKRQFRAAGVPLFVKQLGSNPDMGMYAVEPLAIKDRKGGDMSEWPEDLRIRQYPDTQKART